MHRPPWWRRARRRCYWLLTWKLLLLARVLPAAWGRGLGVGLARLARTLRPGDVAVARANLALAFPELDGGARERLLADAVRHLGRNLFHTLAAPRLVSRPGFVVAANPTLPGDGPLPDRLAEIAGAGRGGFILTGHIGCWELAGAWVARQLAAGGHPPLGVVTGTIHNPPVDRLVQRRRRALGLLPLPRGLGAAPVVRHLRRGGLVAVLPDQATTARNVDVPFFGRPAPTPVGLARLARRYRAPVLPVAGVWDEARGVLVMRHLPPLAPPGPDEDDVAFLGRCNAALENFIRRNPEQWVWFHRRWMPGP